MKAKNVMIAVLNVIVIVLEALPYGAVLNFANPEGEAIRRTYSYFSLTPYGYANFGPFLTAILTCVLLILMLIQLFKNSKKLKNAVKYVSVLASVISLMPLLYGISSFSLVGACISILLIEITVLSFIKDENKTNA